MSDLLMPPFRLSLGAAWNGEVWLPELANNETGAPIFSGPGRTTLDAALDDAKKRLQRIIREEKGGTADERR